MFCICPQLCIDVLSRNLMLGRDHCLRLEGLKGLHTAIKCVAPENS